MKKIDLSVKRRRYWSEEINSSDICPECEASLIKENHSYFLATKDGDEYDTFIAGNDGGHFCPNCPVVVLDKEKFEDAVISAGGSDSSAFMVVGVINLDAIPEDKRDIPMGEDDNPIPLVEFLDVDTNAGRESAKTGKKKKPVRSKKIGRNEPCPCGSGKKYKKCCHGKH